MAQPAPRHAVSVKGVVIRDGRVVLLRNERDEWELPGGKLEAGEDPAACVVREIAEEVGWDVTAGPLLDAWQYHIRTGVDVLVLTYGCLVGSDRDPVVSAEHTQVGMFARDELPALPMPTGYRDSIDNWHARLAARRTATKRPSTLDARHHREPRSPTTAALPGRFDSSPA